MKLNQRKHNNEQGKQQRELRSKILQKYKNHIQNVIEDSQISFDSIETPGWTSLVNTQQSKFTNFYNKKNQKMKDTHIQILSRLNSLPKLDTKMNSYSNIRLNPTSAKNKNLIIYGSAKLSETPKSRQSQKNSVSSKRLQKNHQKDFNSLKKNQNESSSNKFLNRFNKNRPNIFFSVEKPIDPNLKTTRKRVQSVRSQPTQNLKEKIQQRLSMGNNRPMPNDADFERNIFTEPNEEVLSEKNHEQKNNFYSLNNQQKALKDQKNQYFNRYMNKLNLRTKNEANVKVFKRPNFNQSTNKQSKITTKMDIIKEKQNTSKRFNSITVHDYLYQDHIKLESKKKVQRMIQDSYNKATNFTFTPFVSEKSNLLADSKFERQSIEGKKQQSNKHSFDNCFKKIQKKQGKPLKSSIYTIQQQTSMKQKSKMSEIIQNATFLRLFKFLSNNTSQIDNKTVQFNIEKLPLSLIELIEPFLTKIYKKQKFSQKRFLNMFSSMPKEAKQEKNLSSRRLVIIAQADKFFRNLGLKKNELNSIKQGELNHIR